MGNCKGKEKWWKFPYARWVVVVEKAAVSWAAGSHDVGSTTVPFFANDVHVSETL